jgi:hypothetical protein
VQSVFNDLSVKIECLALPFIGFENKAQAVVIDIPILVCIEIRPEKLNLCSLEILKQVIIRWLKSTEGVPVELAVFKVVACLVGIVRFIEAIVPSF